MSLTSLPAAGPHYGGQGRYKLRLPGEPKPKLRTRMTTFVKAFDDSTALIPWSVVMALQGLSGNPALRAEWSALLAEHPDPYYDGDEAKERAKDIAERAKEAGGGGLRRDTGTALHDMLELVVTGRTTVDKLADEWRWHATAVLEMLDTAGYDVVPELCERTVYHAGHDLCGRFDLILKRRADGKLVIGDLKTGGVLWKPKLHYKTKRQTGWYDAHDMNDLTEAAQLAGYAGATFLVTWPADPDDECTVEPMPELDQSEGVIIHAPSTERGVNLRRLDLEAGRVVLELAKEVRALKAKKALLERIGQPAPPVPGTEPTPTERQPDDPPGDTAVLPGPDLPVVRPAAEPSPVAPSAPIADAELVAWIKGGLEACIEHEKAGPLLVEHWPKSLPTFRQAREAGRPWAVYELDILAEVIAFARAECRMPFGDPDPRKMKPTTSALIDPEFGPLFPTPQPPDEGGRLDDVAIANLKSALALLPADQLAFVTELANEAAACGVHVSLVNWPTERRAAIAYALIALAGCKSQQDAYTILQGTTPDDARTGDIVGNLTTKKAVAIRALADLAERA